MRYDYFRPAADLWRHIGAYYTMLTPQGGTEITRAEIPHIRVVLAGEMMIRQSDYGVRYRAPSVVLSGPAMCAGSVAFAPGTLVFGASLTPVGWYDLIGISADELATRQVLLEALREGLNPASIQDQLIQAFDHTHPDKGAYANVADALFRGLLKDQKPALHADFIEAVSHWLLDERSPGIETLGKTVDLSCRQLDRLCNTYFGAPPKRLQRKYRALHIANRIAWTGEGDWRAVVGEHYYDQSHFIRDFKEMVGCTPGQYIQWSTMMIRLMMMKRLMIPHHNRLSLVG